MIKENYEKLLRGEIEIEERSFLTLGVGNLIRSEP
jgi:hypothetical protein